MYFLFSLDNNLFSSQKDMFYIVQYNIPKNFLLNFISVLGQKLPFLSVWSLHQSTSWSVCSKRLRWHYLMVKYVIKHHLIDIIFQIDEVSYCSWLRLFIPNVLRIKLFVLILKLFRNISNCIISKWGNENCYGMNYSTIVFTLYRNCTVSVKQFYSSWYNKTKFIDDY